MYSHLSSKPVPRLAPAPLEPEDIILSQPLWQDGATVTFDAGAAFCPADTDVGYVRLTVGKWAPGKSDDPQRTADDLDGFTVCYMVPEDARLAAMALHEAADQMFRAAADLDKRRCMYRATHGREALAAQTPAQGGEG